MNGIACDVQGALNGQLNSKAYFSKKERIPIDIKKSFFILKENIRCIIFFFFFLNSALEKENRKENVAQSESFQALQQRTS